MPDQLRIISCCEDGIMGWDSTKKSGVVDSPCYR